MKTVLVIYASLNQQDGNSTQLAQRYVQALKDKQDINLIERDLVAMQLDHLSVAEMQAWSTDEVNRDAKQRELAALSDMLIAEVRAADEIVLGVPMYNFGIPSVLKAWLDRLARAGITFRYTDSGPVGLLTGKQVTIVAARGGMYAGTERDTQSAYLRHFFAFLGLTDVRMVYAEGLAMGEESASQGFASAQRKIIELTA